MEGTGQSRSRLLASFPRPCPCGPRETRTDPRDGAPTGGARHPRRGCLPARWLGVCLADRDHRARRGDGHKVWRGPDERRRCDRSVPASRLGASQRAPYIPPHRAPRAARTARIVQTSAVAGRKAPHRRQRSLSQDRPPRGGHHRKEATSRWPRSATETQRRRAGSIGPFARLIRSSAAALGRGVCEQRGRPPGDDTHPTHRMADIRIRRRGTPDSRPPRPPASPASPDAPTPQHPTAAQHANCESRNMRSTWAPASDLARRTSSGRAQWRSGPRGPGRWHTALCPAPLCCVCTSAGHSHA